MPMSFAIEDAVTYRELRKEHILAFAKKRSVPRVAVERELKRLLGGVEAAALTVMNEFGTRTDVPQAQRAGQMRMIRSIVHSPITGMAKQLR